MNSGPFGSTPAPRAADRLSLAHAMALVALLGLCFATLSAARASADPAGRVAVLSAAALNPALIVACVGAARMTRGRDAGWLVALGVGLQVACLVSIVVTSVVVAASAPHALPPLLLETLALLAYLAWRVGR